MKFNTFFLIVIVTGIMFINLVFINLYQCNKHSKIKEVEPNIRYKDSVTILSCLVTPITTCNFTEGQIIKTDYCTMVVIDIKKKESIPFIKDRK